ncbi:glycoside hydrolase family 19 protein [Pseudothauera rhizosphaerae]|uniref:Glycoside hydrolase family 19 protein n=1 Tax=Pseudothauera rhizosphaerae TaxID=2565932 RepID=A0A4S4ABA5_9RHOO|nr:glycoside hydrolase family 19 protein [Pseudothauera rhizosphaerae]THF55913.1 glycoside hydrolase family 19 protein [Pseudothauera rhizosphaerae]
METLVTPGQLVILYDCSYTRAATFCEPLNQGMREYGIDTPARIAAFLAQIGHESGRLRYVREIWGPTPAQARYEGRKDLGNTEPGDGKKYLGRGLIQITGRANYQQASDALGEDFIAYPALLETPNWAAKSACWWWAARGLNTLADAGDFTKITSRINGGQNGRADRVALHERAQALLA